MSFKSSPARIEGDQELRTLGRQKKLRYGVAFLDRALRGIFQDDLILLGAPSGAGKTQLCCTIALANLEDGKKVFFFALEAGQNEIERRLLYPLVMERFYGDPDRPRLGVISYSDWVYGDYHDAIKPYEDQATAFFMSAYGGLNTFYKHGRFTVETLIEEVTLCAESADLIIIDHAHYFDIESENENQAVKEIARTARTLALENQTPILLVAHLRKRDRQNADLVAGLEEFHGSSDLFKNASRVITLSPGKPTPEGKYETFFRIPKDRNDGGVSRYIARHLFCPKSRHYDLPISLGWADQKQSQGFALIAEEYYPQWARPSASGRGGLHGD